MLERLGNIVKTDESLDYLAKGYKDALIIYAEEKKRLDDAYELYPPLYSAHLRLKRKMIEILDQSLRSTTEQMFNLLTIDKDLKAEQLVLEDEVEALKNTQPKSEVFASYKIEELTKKQQRLNRDIRNLDQSFPQHEQHLRVMIKELRRIVN